LYITTGIQDSGGVSRVLSVKFDYFIKYFNYEIIVVNSNFEEVPFFYAFNTCVKFYHVRSSNFFSFKNEIFHSIEVEKPDIVVNCDNGFKGTLLTYFFKKKTPFVYERHCSRNVSSSNIADFFKLKISNVLLDIKIKQYSSFVVLNEGERQTWKSNNIVVIPNPLWFDIPPKVNSLENKCAIAVGRQSAEKRYDKLIGIWKEVVMVNPDWILKIYGKNNDNLKLKELVTELKLNDNVKFFNPITNVEEIYSKASILLMVSESEAFGLVLIEAMAFGLPVIAFNSTSGTDMLIEDNVNGILVEKDDFSAYEDKVTFLIKNLESRKLLGKQAKTFVQKFEINSIMNQWNDLFQNIS